MVTSETALFADNVLAVREERHLSQSDVSDRSGIHVTEVSRIERGLRDLRLSTLLRLACALEVEPARLIGGIGALPAAGQCQRCSTRGRVPSRTDCQCRP